MIGKTAWNRQDRLWLAAFGAVVGGVSAAGVYLLQRALRRQEEEYDRDEARLAALEERVVDALDAADELNDCPIEVAALADGIVELSGAVRDESESERAVAVAHTVAGVRTVLNRLDVGDLEAHLADNRERYAAGDPALREQHWYGLGVGTGRRRQSPQTDPPRRDDRVDMLDRALDVDRAVEADGAFGGEPHDNEKPVVDRDLDQRAGD
jgi:hypothetical protein